MLSPEEIDALAEQIVNGHEQAMVRKLVDQLVGSLVGGGTLSVKDMRLLESVSAMNAKALSDILTEHAAAISSETKRLVSQALEASDADDVEVLSSVYDVTQTPGATAVFARMAQETAEGLASIIARDNLNMTTTAESLWYDVAGEAITNWNHGSMTKDEIIGKAVSRLSSEGVSVINYASGVRSSIDAAVRRHVISQVGQASGRMTMRRIDQYGHDLVYVSAHFGARPEHAVWQGKAYSLSGGRPGYPDFYAETGYGTVTGLLGVNCRHTFGPYFPGITKLPELPERVRGMTSNEYYEATQKQRRYERSIRQAKREAVALNRAGADDTMARLRIGKQQRALKSFVDQNQLIRQPKREKAYGIGAQPRGSRVAARQRPMTVLGDECEQVAQEIGPLDHERMVFLDSSGHRIVTLDDGQLSQVGIPADLIHSGKLARSIGIHNHPGSTSFSKADITLAARIGVSEMRVVARNGTEYVMSPENGSWLDVTRRDSVPLADVPATVTSGALNTLRKWDDAISYADELTRNRIQSLLNKGDITFDTANAMHAHERWSLFSKWFTVRYKRIDR